MYHFGLAQDVIDGLTDEEFIDLAGRAYFYEERRALAVKRGVLMAVEELFKK